MILDDKPYTFDRVVRIFIVVGLCGAAIWLMRYLSDVLIPFVAALLLAYLINPFVNMVQRLIYSRVLSVLLVLALFAAILLVSALLITPVIQHETAQMSALLMRVAQDSDLTSRAAEHIPPGIWQTIQKFATDDTMQQIQTLLSKRDLWALLQAAARKLLPGIWSIIHGTASFFIGLLGLFIVVLYLVFLLVDFHNVKEKGPQLIPARWRSAVMQFASDFNGAMNKYFRAQALIAFLVGILFALGFWLIDLPGGIILGLCIGLLNMVPYLQTIGLLPAGLLAVLHAVQTDSSIWVMLLLTLGVFAVVQAIQDAVLTPRIMGNVTGLSPAVILLSLSVWGKLLGLLGLIIAIPITCLLLAYYRRVTEPESGQATTPAP